MKTLSYSPYMEAHVAVTENGATSYYDISGDIVSGSVTRNQDSASTFSLVLANRKRKYDDVFSPMDRISMSLYKKSGERQRVLTGYITEVPKFNVYGTQVRIAGKCSLYRLQRLYWDAGLLESRRDVLGWSQDMDWAEVTRKLLVKVGGYPEDAVKIGEMPTSVIEWAKSLYMAKLDDIEQAKDLANQFYSMLAVSGPQLMSGGVGGEVGDISLEGNEVVEQCWNYFTKKLHFSKQAAAAILGTWNSESGIDPTSIEGIYDEKYTLGPKKKAAMADWQSYTLNVLFPMYAGRLSINEAAYKGSDGKYYPGVGFAGYTGPRVTELFDFAREHGKKWYQTETQLMLFTRDITSGSHTALNEPSFRLGTDIDSLVHRFVLNYEMPGGIPAAWLANRRQGAHDVYNTFA